MKKLFFSAVAVMSITLFLNGCIAIGTGPKSQQTNATLGQQLIDLQTAKTTGAITPAEYETQKAKLLAGNPDSHSAK